MLVELMVENYAVIERLRVRFHAGFHVLSGETGSGKSILVDALGLLFGGRASAEMVRTGCEKSRVAGIFEVARTDRFEALGLSLEDGELLIEREILANGKSRAFAASRPVTVNLLRDLAPLLGDIHGQHDQQRLFDAGEQLEMVDEFARIEPLLHEAGARYKAWKQASAELEELDRTEKERLRLADLWAYQVKEIETVAPKAGEDETLEHEKKILQNVAKLEESAAAAYEALYDSSSAAVSQMRQARKRIEELARIDTAMAPLVEALTAAAAQTEDVSLTLRDYLGRLEADPAKLDTVESRLAAMDRLKRKYGATLEEVLAFYDTTKGHLDTAETAEAHREQLKALVEKAAVAYRESSGRLSRARREAASKLEKKVEAELSALAMERTRFRVGFGEGSWTVHGWDTVEFLISPNLGEEPKPLNKIASGGELSRVALALKAAVLGTSQGAHGCRTLVFDEVDAGIGGGAAESVGRRLKRIAGADQVLCVTHLAQIAGFGDRHYAVGKKESNGRTVATIEEIEGDARTREIGRMLSGQLTPEALQHAEQLLKAGAAG